jgi:choline dehydrogenase-like flavoprotein
MHTDARKLENESLIEGDICIVGAGAAGISMAMEMINTPYKVILLEGGGFELDMRMQDLYRGKSIGQRYYPLQSSRLHYFGGTTGHWAGFCSPFDQIDFQKREWVEKSGWPIQLNDLLSYYNRAWKLVELESENFELEYWRKRDRELVPLPLDENVVRNKIFQFSPPTRFGTHYRDEIVNAKNIELLTHANVVNIEMNESVSSVKQVRIKNFAGKEHTVRAKYFVLACCAIQNARLLLASNSQVINGLGNEYDLVGRYFMEHLETKAATLVMPHDYSMKLYRQWEFGKIKVRAELVVSEYLQRECKMLNGSASLIPTKFSKGVPPSIDTFPEDADIFLKVWNDMEKNFREEARKKVKEETHLHKEFEFFTRMEQSPNPNSRIQLDHEKDELGMPRVTLNWKLTELDKHSFRELYKTIGQEVGRAGVGRVQLMDWLQDENNQEWPPSLGGGWHHMGTTRMADNPRDGVVDLNCQVYGISNLFLAGSSCFATSGSANPTLTILALTLRLSDHLKAIIKQSDELDFAA